MRPWSGLSARLDARAFGARLSLGARFFPIHQAPEGLWIAAEAVPEFNFVADTDESGPYTSRERAIGLLGMLGYSYIAPFGFTLSGGFGFGVGYFHEVESRTGQAEVVRRGLRPQLGAHANVGWAF